jgi:hypothetical protein
LFTSSSRARIEGLAILLEAGIPPSFRNNQAFHHAILAKNKEACRLLLVHGANPFDEPDGDDDDDDDGNQHDHPTVLNYTNCLATNRVDWSSVHGGPGPSPFHTAARQDDIQMFEFFLDVWNERFIGTNNGVNDMGEYPIHAICRDENVSLAAVKLLLIDGIALHASKTHNGLYPFQIAALNGTRLYVVFTLFQQRAVEN